MLGYCMHCKTLRTLRRLPNRNRTGEIDYAPIEHGEPHTHTGCGGIVREFTCERCGPVAFEQVSLGLSTCPGVGKAMR